MKISTRRDVDVAPAQVFAALTDFATFERKARAKGIRVDRVEDGTDTVAAWRIRFDYRGRSRAADLRVVTFDTDTQLAIKVDLEGLNTLFNIEIMEVAPHCTRMFVSVDIRPSTMTGRLLVQSLKLAKSALTRRLDKRLENFARDLETQGNAGV